MRRLARAVSAAGPGDLSGNARIIRAETCDHSVTGHHQQFQSWQFVVRSCHLQSCAWNQCLVGAMARVQAHRTCGLPRRTTDTTENKHILHGVRRGHSR